MARGRERVLEMDLDVAAPERRAVLDVVLHAAVVPGHGLDDEPCRARAGVAAGLDGVDAGRVDRRARRTAAFTGRRRSLSALRATQSRKR